MTVLLADALASRAAPATAGVPRIFDLASPSDRAELTVVVERTPDLHVHDTLDEQLRDLIATRNPSRLLTRAELDAAVLAHLGDTPPGDYGRWVLFPWSRRLVHLLGPSEFHELRTDRNRYKITAAEQAALARRTIGIVGLSVGQATAITLALEGVGGRFRLADYDTLALSNLNRLRAGVHGLGTNKAILASREMYEIDPYLDIEVFLDGITADNVEPFLAGSAGADPLDLLVEECDDLVIKLRLRERARELRIAVVMETSDRGMIDWERFDREPARPLLHGLLGDHLTSAGLGKIPPPDRLPIALGILGNDAMSTAGLASLVEIKSSISTWPQLASGVALGGALVTDSARRMLLGRLSASGRFYVDLEQLIRDGSQSVLATPRPRSAAPTPHAITSPSALPPIPPSSRQATSTDEEIRWMVAHAALAPSAANAQPWRFTARDSVLTCAIDADRANWFLDDQGRSSRIALGSAIENLVLAARAIGLEATLHAIPESPAWSACEVRFRRVLPVADPLFAMISSRATNHRLAARVPLRESDRESLLAALPAGAHLAWIDDAERLDRLAVLVGAADRIQLQDQASHHAFFSAIRWTPDEAVRRRDGIDVATLELLPTPLALLRVASNWPAMSYLARSGVGIGLEQPGRRLIAGCSAVAFLTVEGTDPRALLEGGRALQRVWLAATACGMSLQPLGNFPHLFDRASHESAAALDSLRPEYDSLFPIAAGHTAVLALRLAYADPPTARSLRRPVAEILQFQS